MFEQLGGRKLVAGLIIIAVGIGAVIKFGDVPANMLHLLEVIFGAFSAANVANTLGGLVAESRQAPEVEQTTQDLDTDLLERQKAQIDAAVQAPQGIPVEDAVSAFQAVRSDLATSHQLLNQSLEGVMKSVELSQKTLAALVDRLVK